METFKLSAVVTIGIYTEIHANTLHEAIQIAKERGIEYASRNDPEQTQAYWVADDFDGMPQNIKEE